MAIIGVGVADIGTDGGRVVIAAGAGAAAVISTVTATGGGTAAGAATATGIGTDDATGIIDRHMFTGTFVAWLPLDPAAFA